MLRTCDVDERLRIESVRVTSQGRAIAGRLHVCGLCRTCRLSGL